MDTFADVIACFQETQKDHPLTSIFLDMRKSALPAPATLLLFQGLPLTRVRLPETFLRAPGDVKAIAELKSEPEVVSV